MNKIIVTEDGSHTLYSEKFNEHYHSIHGAIQESTHVFIEAGLKKCTIQDINILEIGFGTGLNVLLSYIESVKHNLSIKYTSLELYPLNEEEVERINYATLLEYGDVFQQMHMAEWEEWVALSDSFQLKKVKADLTTVAIEEHNDLIYFDAFSPDMQPELWSEEIFAKLARQCKPGCILTTYSAKGAVRRALQSAGFVVERIPGPPGKREMLRATYPRI